MSRLLLVFLLGLSTLSSAQDTEVHNPFDMSPRARRSRPTVAGRLVALRPVASDVPLWAHQEVLNPWDNSARPNLAMGLQERSLTAAARERASVLAACFPEEHHHQRHWTELTAPSPEGVVNLGGPIARCLRRVMNDLRPSSPLYKLVLRFDEQGLRDIYVIRSNRN